MPKSYGKFGKEEKPLAGYSLLIEPDELKRKDNMKVSYAAVDVAINGSKGS